MRWKHDSDLAFLPTDSELGAAYLREMEYAVDYARVNREAIAADVFGAICTVFPGCGITAVHDCCHNYAAFERHMGQPEESHGKFSYMDWILARIRIRSAKWRKEVDTDESLISRLDKDWARIQNKGGDE